MSDLFKAQASEHAVASADLSCLERRIEELSDALALAEKETEGYREKEKAWGAEKLQLTDRSEQLSLIAQRLMAENEKIKKQLQDAESNVDNGGESDEEAKKRIEKLKWEIMMLRRAMSRAVQTLKDSQGGDSVAFFNQQNEEIMQQLLDAMNQKAEE